MGDLPQSLSGEVDTIVARMKAGDMDADAGCKAIAHILALAEARYYARTGRG